MQDGPLPRALLPAATEAMARFLIGCRVVRIMPDGPRIGRIVETEAYLPDDAASHSFRGVTPRNRAMFLGPGHAYVYRAYGTAWMLNVSAEPAGIGAGVLIRALEPLVGLEAMRADRGGVPDRDLARGPGRLAAALAIDRSLDGIDLLAEGPLYLAPPPEPAGVLGISTRIGITKDAHRPLRFFQRGSRFVSGPAALNRGDPIAAG
ncbi:MAG: DNA-3-methyladenine glycosylase [Rhodospirillales bacterium]|nr:DNA-3-methyladenine glycosylase [Rhodospirillales bacterium]